MRQTGRANFIVIAAVASLLIVVFLLLTAGRSPMGAAGDFMAALARQDARRLAEVTIIGNDDLPTRESKWKKTLDRGRHYIFTYKLDSTREMDNNQAFVRVRLARDANQAGSVDDKYELPLVRVDGRWKVNALELNRGMFPSLPR